MLFYIDHFMETWLLPPGCNLLLALIGFLLWRLRWPKIGKSLMIISLLSLWLLSTPLIAQQMINYLQYQYPNLSPQQLASDKSAAIVILEASLNLETPEYGTPTVSDATLTRIRYAAFLHKKMQTPILVSGNDPAHLSINQADYMAKALKDYFGVPTQWKEPSGFNTAQEGILSAEMLKKSGVKKIYLVTHALHMPRAVYAFQHKGLEIIPAPTGYKSFESSLGRLSALLPSMEGLDYSSAALREYIGLCWYHLYYRF